MERQLPEPRHLQKYEDTLRVPLSEAVKLLPQLESLIREANRPTVQQPEVTLALDKSKAA